MVPCSLVLPGKVTFQPSIRRNLFCFFPSDNHVPGEPVPVEEFETHVRHLHANGDLLFSQEYNSLRPPGEFTWNATLDPENRFKNRYNNIVAYDHSRVRLSEVHGVPGSDYINANYLDGYRKKKAYIATQGPLPETTDDFWRMVWEQGTKTIVMVRVLFIRIMLWCGKQTLGHKWFQCLNLVGRWTLDSCLAGNLAGRKQCIIKNGA